MTQVVEPAAPRPSPAAPRPRPGDERAGRWPVVIVMVLALVCCGLTGNWAYDWKGEHAGDHPVVAQRGALGGMNSYSLALMLGGLRGPLVMVLWSKVEGQKIDRDLEDVDTMIEWIRLLQPEFDTVHIFQIWNKAYNISALMASSASKYETILDAIDYGRRVEAEKPGDLNILDQLARVFGEKLGGQNVQERGFYRKQFMEDSLTDANRRKAYPEDDATYRRMGVKFFESKNGPLLTESNELDPRLLVTRYPRPASVPANSEWNTGAEFQYLEPYQPFPLGIPPMAIGYNYAKQSQVAMTVGGQKPLQLSDTVIDTYPGIMIKQWAQFELDRAVGYEGQAFGLRIGNDPIPSFIVANANPPTATVTNARAMQDAVYGYDLGSRLCDAAIKEYERHLANPQYVNPYMSYASQLLELRAQHALAAADAVYAKSFMPGADRAALLSEAQGLYRDALSRYKRIVLLYCMEPSIRTRLFPKGPVDFDKLSDAQLDQVYLAYVQLVRALPPASREFDDSRTEYMVPVTRAQMRVEQLSGFGQRSILETH